MLLTRLESFAYGVAIAALLIKVAHLNLWWIAAAGVLLGAGSFAWRRVIYPLLERVFGEE